MQRWLSFSWLVVALAVLSGCNFIAFRQGQIEGSMRAAGLTVADKRIGADTIHYWAGGKGPTVVLVHGFGASAEWLWYPQVGDLARDHRVIAADLLWFGESKSEVRDYSIDHQVHALEVLLDQLGEREVDVVGISYGGLVAHEFASDRASQVRRLVMVDTPGRVFTREDYRGLCGRLGVDHVGRVLVPSDASGVERLLGLSHFDPPWAPGFALQQALDTLYSSFRDEKVKLLDALIDNMETLKARPVTLRAATMVVWGRQDPVFTLDVGVRLAKSLGAPLRILEKARHAPNLEHPEAFNEILRGFLSTPN
jgi:pimeloyl-ACP methyl ester carboxylesterase